MQLKMYYVPCPTIQTAKDIAESLLSTKKIACANILPQMTSMYWWEGKIEHSNEAVLLLKTNLDHTTITTEVKKLHPYEIPAVIELAVNNTNKDYANWLKSSLK